MIVVVTVLAYKSVKLMIKMKFIYGLIFVMFLIKMFTIKTQFRDIDFDSKEQNMYPT